MHAYLSRKDKFQLSIFYSKTGLLCPGFTLCSNARRHDELLICSVICDSTWKKSGSLGIIFFEEHFLLSSILRLKKTQGKTHKARGRVLGVFVLL